MSPAARTVHLSHELYPQSAIGQARQAFVELCNFAEEVPGPYTVLTIVPVEGAPPQTVGEFLSYLLCAALELHLAEAS